MKQTLSTMRWWRLETISQVERRAASKLYLAATKRTSFQVHFFDLTFDKFCELKYFQFSSSRHITHRQRRYFNEMSIMSSYAMFINTYLHISFECYNTTRMTTPINSLEQITNDQYLKQFLDPNTSKHP